MTNVMHVASILCVNFPFMSSNIPSAQAYGVYASQLIRYARCAQIIVTFYHATGP